MNVPFIPEEYVSGKKTSIILCGLNGEGEWAKEAIRDTLGQEYHIVEQDQFMPPSKSPKSPHQKTFPLEWISSDRLLLVIEIFVGDLTGDQLLEDISFSSKYVRNFQIEHLPVVLGGERSELKEFKAFFLAQEAVHHQAQALPRKVKFLVTALCKDRVRKYRRYMQEKISRFNGPWLCKAYYTCKCAVYFEYCGEQGNALREYHQAYSAIVDQCSQESDACEYKILVREFADIVLLRMTLCMVKLGSAKGAIAFLDGHLNWFQDSFQRGDVAMRRLWMVRMNYHFASVLEVQSEHNPGRYYMNCLALANRIALTETSYKFLVNDVYEKAKGWYSGFFRSLKALEYLVLFIKHRYGTPIVPLTIPALTWNKLCTALLCLSSQPSLSTVWQLVSLTRDWGKYNVHEYSGHVTFPATINSVLLVSADFDQFTGYLSEEANIVLCFDNTSGFEFNVETVQVDFSDLSTCFSYSHVHLPRNTKVQSKVKLKLRSFQELSISRIQLSLDKNIVLEFNKNAFETSHPLKVKQKVPYITISTTEGSGLVGFEECSVLTIHNHDKRPIRGVVKLTDIPSALRVERAFPFGVSGQGMNNIKISFKSNEQVEGEIKFELEYSAVQQDPAVLEVVHSLKELALPICIREPFEYSVGVERKDYMSWSVAFTVTSARQDVKVFIDGSEVVGTTLLECANLPSAINVKWTSGTRNGLCNAKVPQDHPPFFVTYRTPAHGAPMEPISGHFVIYTEQTVQFELGQIEGACYQGPRSLLVGPGVALHVPFTLFPLRFGTYTFPVTINGTKISIPPIVIQ